MSLIAFIVVLFGAQTRFSEGAWSHAVFQVAHAIDACLDSLMLLSSMPQPAWYSKKSHIDQVKADHKFGILIDASAMQILHNF